MKNLTYILLASLFSLIASTNITNAQSDIKRINIANTSASIIPPKHFEYKADANTLTHKGSLCTILIKEIKGKNYKRITKGLTKKYLTTQEFTLISTEDTKTAKSKNATIIICSFKSRDTKGNSMNFTRIMLFTGDENTIWITADYPTNHEKLLKDVILTSILSIE